MTISTHVLDAARGRPAVGMALRLTRLDDGAEVGHGRTNDDGRCPELTDGLALDVGTYRMRFDTAEWFATQGVTEFFYPYAEIVFTVTDAAAHYHVPLLLSPFAYSTYRGS